MKKNHSREDGKGGRNLLNVVVNVAVLLFLAYAMLGSDGLLTTKIREYVAAREVDVAVRDLMAQLISEGRAKAGQPTIIEFTDFQCPYCRDMHGVLWEGTAEHEFDLVVMHFPLERIHPLAKSAAKASLCAEAQGLAHEMNLLLMSTRDWMDDSDWGRLAGDARVPDVAEFEECLVFGGEGDGPGEFRSLAFIRRGPNGTVGVFDLELSRLTVFTPAGVRVAETRLPPGFVPGGPFGTSALLGQLFKIPDGDMVPVELDAATGEILWQRDHLDGLAQTECGELIAELPSSEGGWVFRACQREIVFLTDRDADAVTTVEAPTYVEELPNERDVEWYRDAMAGISGGAGTSLPASAWEPYLTEFRETPKRWFLRSRPMAYDGQDRLWVATARDRDTFSYLDIYVGTGYVGTVRIRDRLMGYDLLGSTMAALVERRPGRDGIARRAIDWYRIDGLDVGSPP